MKNKIAYFMEKDTRLIVENLSKVIFNENQVFVNYTISRRSLKDEKTIVVRYIKNKNRVFIYDKLKEYNPNVYKGFIDWANEKGIKWYSFGEVIIDEKEEV